MLSQETQTNFSMTQLYSAETVTVAQELESEAEISNTNTTSRLPNTKEPASQARGTTSLKKRKRQKPKPLTKVLLLENGGMYMHFGVEGLEAALAGEYPGQQQQISIGLPSFNISSRSNGNLLELSPSYYLARGPSTPSFLRIRSKSGFGSGFVKISAFCSFEGTTTGVAAGKFCEDYWRKC
ncbi:hypothetical protein DAPPUDRAFT_253254 [Daphnia pulex]|uniref:Uncharacterized protein n=1 Tax=Daphnia pulex TaxID=6669 RepID=E9H4E5_DAPPU|nr:hypothetical protein DAPPUDRAFT_253254 [Daphnia pulex]|eukprot:EFX73369.1 hypothetical protein DAPPUDRAFT_253254 [Daphnia pulex]